MNQIVRKFGSKRPDDGKLRGFYDAVSKAVSEGVALSDLAGELRKNPSYTFLQPDETPYQSSKKGYSTRVKTGILVDNFLKNAPRCPECNGILPIQSMSVDHIDRMEDGGESTTDNAQVMHPYCNTGHKEKRVHASRK